ncbi:MAG: riboflavin synthase, partial [Actinobacteria bacterium]|nr:riboflavin synthase [Actinomycetota bacterium]
ITVDGVSLTVATRDPAGFTIALIPHTMEMTTLGPQAVGRRVNLEADVVAKYVEALVRPHTDGGGSS